MYWCHFNDFRAMENWGLITYRETAMLYDPKVSSDLSKLRVATGMQIGTIIKCECVRTLH